MRSVLAAAIIFCLYWFVLFWSFTQFRVLSPISSNFFLAYLLDTDHPGRKQIQKFGFACDLYAEFSP